MPKFILELTYDVPYCGYVTVEAETLEAAMEATLARDDLYEAVAFEATTEGDGPTYVSAAAIPEENGVLTPYSDLAELVGEWPGPAVEAQLQAESLLTALKNAREALEREGCCSLTEIDAVIARAEGRS
jgi:hypothetical protein